MQNVRNFDLLSLIPPSIRGDSQVIASCKALEGELQAVSMAIDNILIISKMDTLPESVIDNLAWQWHVDFYDDTMTIDIKRELVKNAIAWHRRKGTPAIVQEYVSTVLSAGVVSEWFDYAGEPYHFKISTDQIITDVSLYDRLLAVVNAVKNVRSWLDGVSIKRKWSGNMYVGGALYRGQNLTIGPVQLPAQISNNSEAYVGGAVYFGKNIIVRQVPKWGYQIGGYFPINN